MTFHYDEAHGIENILWLSHSISFDDRLKALLIRAFESLHFHGQESLQPVKKDCFFWQGSQPVLCFWVFLHFQSIYFVFVPFFLKPFWFTQFYFYSAFCPTKIFARTWSFQGFSGTDCKANFQYCPSFRRLQGR